MKKIITLIVMATLLTIGCASTPKPPTGKFQPGQCFSLPLPGNEELPGKILALVDTELGPLYVMLMFEGLMVEKKHVVEQMVQPMDCPL